MAVKPGGRTDPARRLERLVRDWDKEFQKVFLQAIGIIRSQTTLDELAELIAAGRLEEALGAITRAGELLGDTYGAALVASAQNTAAFLSGALTVAVSFDQTNFRAVSQMQSNRLRLIREFTADQRATLRQSLSRSIAEGINPRDAARRFRESIGLTARQEAAVANYRRLLEGGSSEALSRQLRDRRFDRTIRRAIAEGRPLTKREIDRMVSRYSQRYVKYRSEVIARTEALRSVHQGSEDMYRQAIESGDLDANSLVRTWITAKDERVRGSHRRLNGLERAVGDTWPGDEGPLKHPGDPDAPGAETIQCRCVLTTRIKDVATEPDPDPPGDEGDGGTA